MATIIQFPVNDNCPMGKCLMDWQIRTERQQYDALLWTEKLDCCDPVRLVAWQCQTGKTVPTYAEARFNGLLLTIEEIKRARGIEQSLITRGKI